MPRGMSIFAATFGDKSSVTVCGYGDVNVFGFAVSAPVSQSYGSSILTGGERKGGKRHGSEKESSEEESR